MKKGRFTEVISEAKLAQKLDSEQIEDQRSGNIPLSKISLPKQQPRRYFDPAKMQDLIRSISKNGILEPLLVRPLPRSKYELVAGERRLRAAKALKLKEVPAVIRKLDDDQALQLAIIENLQREDLNPVEETEAIIGLISIQVKMDTSEVPSLLYKMQNEEKGKITPSVWGNPNGDAILEVFENLGLNWKSFVKTRLPLLKLPSDVLESLMQGQIEYTKATVISRIKDESQRKEFLSDAIDKDLSLKEIKTHIKALKTNKEAVGIVLKSRFSNTYTSFKKSKVWDNPKKQKQLEKLVLEFETKIAKLIEDD